MELEKATDDELIAECKKRGINIISPALYKLWTNPDDNRYDHYKEG